MHSLWDQCFYSRDQRNDFGPIHCIEFTDELLQEHEDEAKRLKKYLDENKELFDRVAMRQDVWKSLWS